MLIFTTLQKVLNDGICYSETNLYRVHTNIARKPKTVRKPCRCWSLMPTIYVHGSSLRLFGPTMDLKGMDETNHEHKRLQNSTNSKSNMLLVKRPILVSVTYASLTESSGKTSETKHFQLRNKPQSGMLSSKI